MPNLITVFSGDFTDEIDLIGARPWELKEPVTPSDLVMIDHDGQRLQSAIPFEDNRGHPITYRVLIRSTCGPSPRYFIVGILRDDLLDKQRPRTSRHAEVSKRTARHLILKSRYPDDFSGTYDLPDDLKNLPSQKADENPPPGADGIQEKKPKVSLKKADVLVRDYLKKNPHPQNITEVAHATGASTGTVCKTQSWKTYMATRPQKKGRRTRPIRLAHEMIASLSGNDADPASIADQMEILERQYLESVGTEERAEFHVMESEEKTHTLWAWYYERDCPNNAQ